MPPVLLPIISLALSSYASNSSCFSAIDWQPCPGATQRECASYQVPLDYAHPEVGNATLAVARIKATNQPRLGTLFTNPGGPGNSGVGDILGETGDIFSNITNGQYDIVSWDPRGVNQSKPLISCGFATADDYEQFWNTSLPGPTVEARGNFTDQDDLDAFYAGLNQTDAKLQQFGQKCMDSDGAFLKYMGTAAVVRDMVSLSDCLEGPGTPINFWGRSYGTVLGNYFVNMFPERVGHVVIDGVFDSIIWATEPSLKTFSTILTSTEDTFEGLMQKCAQAGPQGCAFAKNDSTPASLSQDFRALINTTYDLHKANQSIPPADVLRFQVLEALDSPQGWPAVASQLNSAAQMIAGGMAGNPTTGNTTTGNSTTGDTTAGSKRSLSTRPRVPHLPRGDPGISEFGIDLALTLYGVISCVDSIDQDNVTTKQAFDELVRVTREESPMFGETLSHIGFYCQRFPARAVERFTGPFNQNLSNPIMIIGNEADPKTPFANAQKIADTLGSSARLLKQNGFGHTSFAQDSDCTHGAIQDYFLQGTLPDAGKVCEVNSVDVFPTSGNATQPCAM